MELEDIVNEKDDKPRDCWRYIEENLDRHARRTGKTAQNRLRQRLRQLLGDQSPTWLENSASSLPEQTIPVELPGPNTTPTTPAQIYPSIMGRGKGVSVMNFDI